MKLCIMISIYIYLTLHGLYFNVIIKKISRLTIFYPETKTDGLNEDNDQRKSIFRRTFWFYTNAYTTILSFVWVVMFSPLTTDMFHILPLISIQTKWLF